VDTRFDFALEGVMVGRRHDIDPVTFASIDAMGNPVLNESYWKLNLAGSAHLTRNFSLFTRIDNLLNQDYQEVLGFPAYRTNFTVGIRVRFGGGR
jgi:vitamin B12 transporter